MGHPGYPCKAVSFARRIRRRAMKQPKRSPIETKGDLLGKFISVTGEAGDRQHAELEDHLRQFNLTWLLRRIGEMEGKIQRGQGMLVDGVAVLHHALAYVAMVAIEVADDETPRIPEIADVVRAAKLFNGLWEPSIRGDRVFEFLVRMGYEQFTFFDLQHTLARTWLLYRDLWLQVPGAAVIDIEAAIRAVTGLDLRALIVLALMHSGRAIQGYTTSTLGESAASALEGLGASVAAEERFLRWASAGYQEFRDFASRRPADRGYERYRPNPLLRWPLLRPDVAPDGSSTPVYLAPVPLMVVRRVTEGLHHDLSQHLDRGGGDNPYRHAYGLVLQAYVGHLLRASHGDERVLPEWDYGPKGRTVATPDWLVLEGDRLVVIEVKESVVTLDTKSTGARDAMARDLKKTLSRAAGQVLHFRQDLRNQTVGLERLRHVQHVELMIVAGDRVPFANWVFKEALGLPGAMDIHICSIEEFELLQKRCWCDGMSDLLEAKRHDKRSIEQDFREFCFELGGVELEHPVIEKAYADLAARWEEAEGAE